MPRLLLLGSRSVPQRWCAGGPRSPSPARLAVPRASRPSLLRLVIVAAGVILNALVGSLVMQAYGAYVAVFRDQFGWSSTVLALGYSTIQGTNGVVGPGQGWLTDRFGPARSSAWAC